MSLGTNTTETYPVNSIRCKGKENLGWMILGPHLKKVRTAGCADQSWPFEALSRRAHSCLLRFSSGNLGHVHTSLDLKDPDVQNSLCTCGREQDERLKWARQRELKTMHGRSCSSPAEGLRKYWKLTSVCWVLIRVKDFIPHTLSVTKQTARAFKKSWWLDGKRSGERWRERVGTPCTLVT